MTTYLPLLLLAAVALGLGVWCLRLRRELWTALVDQTYGILTRQGGERSWRPLRSRCANYEVVFFDLDDLHRLNAELGYVEVDRRIRNVLKYRQEDLLIARWYSGDEIIAIVPRGDGAGIAHRLRRDLQAQELSATFGVVPAHSDLAVAVRHAMGMVSAAKASGRRGTVCTSEMPSEGICPHAARRAVRRRARPGARAAHPATQHLFRKEDIPA